MLRAQVADTAAARARFSREVRAVASLSHPNILAIHDYGVEQGVVFAVMELLEGNTQREELRAGALAVPPALDRALRVGRGLSAAHPRLDPIRDHPRYRALLEAMDLLQEAAASADPRRVAAEG